MYRQQVLLHSAWRNESDLKNGDETWQDVATKLGSDSMSNRTVELNMKDKDDEEFEPYNENCSDIEEDEEWMLAASLMPNKPIPEIDLGKRDVDVSFDWNSAYDKYQTYGSIGDFQSFISKHKEQSPDPIFEAVSSSVQFSSDQEEVIQLLHEQIQNIQSNAQQSSLVPRTCIVQGKAGK